MITMKSWLRMTCFLTLTMGTASGSVYAEDASVLKCSVTEVADDGSIKFNDDNLSVEINKDFSVQTPAGKTVKFSTEDGTITIDIDAGRRKATSNRAGYLLRALPSPNWGLTSYLRT